MKIQKRTMKSDRFEWEESKAANDLYEKVSKEFKYARLISSHHWASEGYWVEYDNNPLPEVQDTVLDNVLKEKQ